jgi:osmotically-inducible protein OsmY
MSAKHWLRTQLWKLGLDVVRFRPDAHPLARRRRLVERAGIYLAVQQDDEESLVLSGMVSNEELHQAALDITSELAGSHEVVDDIEVLDALPSELSARQATTDDERDSRVIHPPGVSLEPGDFTSQDLVDSPDEAAGPSASLEDDDVGDGDEVYIPPTDPTLRDENEVVGGLQVTSMDDTSVEESSDHTLGDEAIRDAIVRELREDAATTNLEIEVEVNQGVAWLLGTVQTLEDLEAAEEVTSRVPGVVEVAEDLEVSTLGRS